MKVFRRPMFRKGGEAMTGIMENIAPRQNYDEGKSVYDEADAIITERMGPVKRGDPLTDFLLTYGPSLASSALPGGTLRNIVAATDKPVANLLANRKANIEREEARKLAGIQLGESMAERQLKKDIAMMKSEDSVNLLPTFLDLYEGNLTLAQNRNSYEKSGLESRAKNTFGKNYSGLVGGDRHGDIESKTFKNKKNVGKVYYDISDGQFKRIRKTADGFGVEVIDINTFDSAADEAKKAPVESYPGEFSENPSYKRPPKEGFTIEEKDAFDIEDPQA
tara:strand:+ start:1955 stop:2788 length:834 start_codon:yes stop_codon:yes gene_type:complete